MRVTRAASATLTTTSSWRSCATGQWVTLPEVSNQFEYDEDIHAAYVTVGDDREKFTYQLGVRAEATYIGTRLVETNQGYHQNLPERVSHGPLCLPT